MSFTVKDSDGNTVPGTTAFNSADAVATFTPTSPLAAETTYTATVSGAQNTFGTPMRSPYSWKFTTAASSARAASGRIRRRRCAWHANDPSPVNLGVKFTTDANGWISGIRFYKGAGNTGTHVGSLWTSSGALLGQVTFTSESASGWQEADFATPIPVTAGTTYVASYFAPTGAMPSPDGLPSAMTTRRCTHCARQRRTESTATAGERLPRSRQHLQRTELLGGRRIYSQPS